MKIVFWVSGDDVPASLVHEGLVVDRMQIVLDPAIFTKEALARDCLAETTAVLHGSDHHVETKHALMAKIEEETSPLEDALDVQFLIVRKHLRDALREWARGAA